MMEDYIFTFSIIFGVLGFVCFILDIRGRIHKRNENEKLFK